MSESSAPATPALRVAMAQINTTVGDLDANLAAIIDAYDRAVDADADLVVYPEMTISGYPPEDLVHKSGFVAENRATLEKFAAHTKRCAAVVGFADGASADPAQVSADAATSPPISWNAAAICAEGRVVGVVHKRHLPNYDVFDEIRHFRVGADPAELFTINGVDIGVTICEDSWIADGPVTQLARGGAQLVVNINASPFRSGKQELREQVVTERVAEGGAPVVYVNLVGGQDELVFDGGSFVAAPVADGEPTMIARSVRFDAVVDVVDLTGEHLGDGEPAAGPRYRSTLVTDSRDLDARVAIAPRIEPAPSSLAQLWEALVVATRDYVRKSGFTDVLIGLSGGVDSSIVAAVAVDALGADHVHGVLMPSRYSSDHSIGDAEELARRLGIDTRTVAIEEAHQAFVSMIGPHLGDGKVDPGDLTDQNLQSRIRGVILMAVANEHNWLVLTTGNKSEASVGYSTLYGDTAGAYAVIRDVWKLGVYELCEWRNDQADGDGPIPSHVLTKAPSAELRPDQTDDQSLPPYEVLDPILVAYVEQSMTVHQILAGPLGSTADRATIERVCRLVDIAEYKRRQTPLGARVSAKAYGRDRRIPIVNRYQR